MQQLLPVQSILQVVVSSTCHPPVSNPSSAAHEYELRMVKNPVLVSHLVMAVPMVLVLLVLLLLLLLLLVLMQVRPHLGLGLMQMRPLVLMQMRPLLALLPLLLMLYLQSADSPADANQNPSKVAQAASCHAHPSSEGVFPLVEVCEPKSTWPSRAGAGG